MKNINETSEIREFKKDLQSGIINVYATLRKVNKSGTIRQIGFYYTKNNKLLTLNKLIHDVTEYKFNDKHNGLIIGGCGMDVAFKTLSTFYSLIGIKNHELAAKYNYL